MDGQRHADAMATQQLLAGMSDTPGQIRAQPFSGLFKQAERAWHEQHFGADGSMNYLTIPF
ncbi:hypothetical protein [Mycobacterium sp. M23085]|uniref:hypothetical protein n=1 Tax=Mycobacterium sp. M23085 TaxID=3378087 RepID=UPI003877F15B